MGIREMGRNGVRSTGLGYVTSAAVRHVVLHSLLYCIFSFFFKPFSLIFIYPFVLYFSFPSSLFLIPFFPPHLRTLNLTLPPFLLSSLVFSAPLLFPCLPPTPFSLPPHPPHLPRVSTPTHHLHHFPLSSSLSPTSFFFCPLSLWFLRSSFLQSWVIHLRANLRLIYFQRLPVPTVGEKKNVQETSVWWKQKQENTRKCPNTSLLKLAQHERTSKTKELFDSLLSYFSRKILRHSRETPEAKREGGRGWGVLWAAAVPFSRVKNRQTDRQTGKEEREKASETEGKESVRGQRKRVWRARERGKRDQRERGREWILVWFMFVYFHGL